MNTMRRVRLFFGFFAGFIFFCLCLWIGFQKIIERHIQSTVLHHGFHLVSMESVTPLFTGIDLHSIQLTSKDNTKKIFAEKITLTLSWQSIFDKSFEFIHIKGLRYIGQLEDMKSLIFQNLIDNDPSHPFFRTCKLSGFMNLTHQDQDYFIPLELKFTNHPISMGIHGSMRLVSKNIATDIKVHKDYGKENASTHLQFQYLKTRLSDINILAKELLLSVEPKIDDELDFVFNGKDIAFALQGGDFQGRSHVSFDTKTTISMVDSVLKISGLGRVQLDGEESAIALKTVENGVDLNIRSPKLQAKSLLRLLGDYSEESFKHIEGSGSLDLFAHSPINLHLNDEKGRPWAANFFLKSLDGFQYDKHKGFIKINLKDVSLVHAFYSVKKLNATLNFNLFPLQTQGKQVIQAESAQFSTLQLTQPHVSFDITDQLKIDTFIAQTLGGTLKFHSFEKTKLSPESSSTFIFAADHLDLTKALSALDIKGLKGAGQIGAHGQMEYSKSYGFKVKNAKFFSISPVGKINYTGQNIGALDPSLESNNDLLEAILKDLTFSMLTLELLPVQDKLQASIEFIGSNEAVMNGHPYQFKIKTSGENLYAL